MQVIKKEILDRIKEKDNNLRVINRLAYEFDVYTTTAKRWIDTNHVKLTTPMGLKALAEELGVKKSELLTESE